MLKEKGYIEPFKMFDNVYYVGDKWVSSYLITSGKSLLLVDTLEFPYSQWIPINIKKLGFAPDALEYLLITHAHSDHVAGAGYLQGLYDTKVVMAKEDVELLNKQAIKNDFTMPAINFFPEDKESLKFGDNEIRFYKTPGHTDGCMSIALTVYDQNQPEQAFITCGNGTNFSGIERSKEYLSSIKRIRDISATSPQVTVNMPTHPHLGQLFTRRDLMEQQRNTNPFVDKSGFHQFLDLLKERGIKKLENERLFEMKVID
jgi:metallo-beta-lactamase class B